MQVKEKDEEEVMEAEVAAQGLVVAVVGEVCEVWILVWE